MAALADHADCADARVMPVATDKFDPALRSLLVTMGERMDERRQALGLTWASLSWRAEMHEKIGRAHV